MENYFKGSRLTKREKRDVNFIHRYDNVKIEYVKVFNATKFKQVEFHFVEDEHFVFKLMFNLTPKVYHWFINCWLPDINISHLHLSSSSQSLIFDTLS